MDVTVTGNTQGIPWKCGKCYLFSRKIVRTDYHHILGCPFTFEVFEGLWIGNGSTFLEHDLVLQGVDMDGHFLLLLGGLALFSPLLFQLSLPRLQTLQLLLFVLKRR